MSTGWEDEYNDARAEAVENELEHFRLPARDPSLRDVLAKLAEMEAAILAFRTAEIEAKIDALLARMDADEVARG